MIETPKARQAFYDYYNLGPERSLDQLFEQYRDRPPGEAPTRRRATLGKWSSEHHWQARVVERDAEIAKAQLEQLKEKALNSGYALFYQRIDSLGQMAEKLFGEVMEEGRHWRTETRIEGKENPVQVDTEIMNEGLIRQFRGLLDDIAQEMGERDRNIKVKGDPDEPIVTKDISDVRRERWELVAPAIAQALAEDGEEMETDE